MSILSTGASGAQVADLQRRLAQLGYSPGAVDGVFGPATAQALRLYQNASGLPATATYDDVTAQRMTAAGAAQGGPVLAPAPQTAAAMNPEEDPAYLAFLRGQGVAEDELRAATAMRQSLLRQELANRTTASQTQLANQLTDVGQGFADAGSYFSSSRRNAQARTAKEHIAGENVTQTQFAGRQFDLTDNLMTKLADLRRGGTEAGLETRQKLPLDYAEKRIY